MAHGYDSGVFQTLRAPLARGRPWGQGLFLADGPNTEAIVTDAAVALVAAARIEVEEPRVVRDVGVERPRPEAAVAAGIHKLAVATVAGGRQEERLAVLLRGKLAAFHSVLCRPLVGRVAQQFLPLLLAWCAPAAAPVDCGRVVACLQGRQVVGEAVVAVVAPVAVLGQLFVVSISVLVCTPVPVVDALCGGLAPSKVAAVVLGLARAHVAGGPQGAARQAEVNVVVAAHLHYRFVRS